MASQIKVSFFLKSQSRALFYKVIQGPQFLSSFALCVIFVWKKLAPPTTLPSRPWEGREREWNYLINVIMKHGPEFAQITFTCIPLTKILIGALKVRLGDEYLNWVTLTPTETWSILTDRNKEQVDIGGRWGGCN